MGLLHSLESLSPAEREFFLKEGHLYDMVSWPYVLYMYRSGSYIAS